MARYNLVPPQKLRGVSAAHRTHPTEPQRPGLKTCPFGGGKREYRERMAVVFLFFVFSPFLTLLMGFLLYNKLLFSGNKKKLHFVF